MEELQAIMKIVETIGVAGVILWIWWQDNRKSHRQEQYTQAEKEMRERYEALLKESQQVNMLVIQNLSSMMENNKIIAQIQRDIFTRLNQKAFCVFDGKKENHG